MGLKYHLIYICPRPVEASETLEPELKSIIRYVGAGDQPCSSASALDCLAAAPSPSKTYIYVAISLLLFHILDLTK